MVSTQATKTKNQSWKQKASSFFALFTSNLKKDNQLTLHHIRKAVGEGGFKAKEATITITGTVIKNQSGNLVLETRAGEQFLLEAENQRMLDNISKTKGSLTVTGKAKTSDETGTKLWVQTVVKSKT
ncbi:MAG: hypothetical protein WD035_12245 [Balneolaceae bacterium]